MKTIERTIGWSNALLIAAAFCLLLAIAMGLNPGLAAGTPPGLMATGCVIVGGFFAAKGIQEFAGVVFDLDRKPWYGQRGGCIFVVVISTIINFIVLIMLSSTPRLNPFAPVFTPAALFFACYAVELFWVAILDWSSQPAGYETTTQSRHEAPQVMFKPMRGPSSDRKCQPSTFNPQYLTDRFEPEREENHIVPDVWSDDDRSSSYLK